eukprot:554525_1
MEQNSMTNALPSFDKNESHAPLPGQVPILAGNMKIPVAPPIKSNKKAHMAVMPLPLPGVPPPPLSTITAAPLPAVRGGAKKKKKKYNTLEKLLKERPCIKELRQRGIYKYKNKCKQIISEHLIEKKRREQDSERRNAMRKRHHHTSLYIIRVKYKCNHCNKIFTDVPLSEFSEPHSHFHYCYATPYDKTISNVSLQFVNNKKSENCNFKHEEECLFMVGPNDLKKQTSADVSLKDVHKIKQKVKDVVFGYIKMTRQLLNDTTYFKTPSIIKYWCLLYYYCSSKTEFEISSKRKNEFQLTSKYKVKSLLRRKKISLKNDYLQLGDIGLGRLAVKKRKKKSKRKNYKRINYSQTFNLNKNQMELISKFKITGDWLLMIQDINKFGKLLYDEQTGCLEMNLYAAVYRDEVLQIIEKQLGLILENKINIVTAKNIKLSDVKDIKQCDKDTVFGYIKKIRDYVPPIIIYWCLLYYYEKQNELIFPLTDKQMKLLTNINYLEILMNDMKHFGRVRVNNGYLMLYIPIHISIIAPMDKLEKRLGILLTVDEIKQIRG